jgi:hypothetical protein
VIVFELVVAGVLAAFGLRSLVQWMGRTFHAASTTERVLYVVHVTARVGTWFAAALVFAGYALLDEPQAVRDYLLLLIALPGIQLLTGFALSRAPGAESEEGVTGPPPGNGRKHESREVDAGPPGAGEGGGDVRSRPPTASGG